MYGNNYGYQPYFGTQRPTYQQQVQNDVIQQPQFQPQYTQPIKTGLQGEMVESLEVVKALNYPLNGSISYFPSTDGTKIFTKQLQMDGNVKISTYNIEKMQSEEAEQPKYATIEDIETIFNKFDFKSIDDLRDDISEIKKALKKNKKEEL